MTCVGFVLLIGALAWRSAGPLPRFSTIARRCLILMLYTAGILIVVEAVGRPIVARQGSWGTPVHQPHPVLMKTLRPGAEGDRYFVQNDGSRGVYPVRISSQGIRDREYGPKSKGEFRVLLTGDSFALGKPLPIEESLSRQLEISLDNAHPDKSITVVNAGVGGYGPWQAHGFLVETGYGFEPDLVIL